MKYLILLSLFLIVIGCEKNQSTSQDSTVATEQVVENTIILTEACNTYCRDPQQLKIVIDISNAKASEDEQTSTDNLEEDVKDPNYVAGCVIKCLELI